MALQIREAYMNTTDGVIIGQTGWFDAVAPTRENLLEELRQEYGDNVQPLLLDTARPDGEHLPYLPGPADRRPARDHHHRRRLGVHPPGRL
jgi:hypothetical protein